MTPSAKRAVIAVASPMMSRLFMPGRHTSGLLVTATGTTSQWIRYSSRNLVDVSYLAPPTGSSQGGSLAENFTQPPSKPYAHAAVPVANNMRVQPHPPRHVTSKHQVSPSRRVIENILKEVKEEEVKKEEVKEEESFDLPSAESPLLSLNDKRLPCGQHLDPDGTMLPTTDWIHVNGTLPTGSLDQILHSVEQWLRTEEEQGIVDLDAEWNPVQDAQVPLIYLDDLLRLSQDKNDNHQSQRSLVEAAHVVISAFGRPNGWHLKLANRSLVYSILAKNQQSTMRVGWKPVQVDEYHYSREQHERDDPAFTGNEGLVVDDSLVRIENCPSEMDAEYIRHLVSRYELAPKGNTVIRWKGATADGKIAPTMFIVRFASASWARAAVREVQSTDVGSKTLKLIQYPKQIRYQDSSLSE